MLKPVLFSSARGDICQCEETVLVLQLRDSTDRGWGALQHSILGSFPHQKIVFLIVLVLPRLHNPVSTYPVAQWISVSS